MGSEKSDYEKLSDPWPWMGLSGGICTTFFGQNYSKLLGPGLLHLHSNGSILELEFLIQASNYRSEFE